MRYGVFKSDDNELLCEAAGQTLAVLVARFYRGEGIPCYVAEILAPAPCIDPRD